MSVSQGVLLFQLKPICFRSSGQVQTCFWSCWTRGPLGTAGGLFSAVAGAPADNGPLCWAWRECRLQPRTLVLVLWLGLDRGQAGRLGRTSRVCKRGQ